MIACVNTIKKINSSTALIKTQSSGSEAMTWLYIDLIVFLLLST